MPTPYDVTITTTTRQGLAIVTTDMTVRVTAASEHDAIDAAQQRDDVRALVAGAAHVAFAQVPVLEETP